MKKCPYCAEEIQDAAIVCKHCGRELAVATVAPGPLTKRGAGTGKVLGYVLAIGFGLLMLNAVFGGGRSQTPTGADTILKVSAAKGIQSLMVTNRESTALNRCDVRLLDAGEAEWFAILPSKIAPSQTVSVDWQQFRQNGQPMPSYIGRDRKNFIVSCTREGDDARRSAGVSF